MPQISELLAHSSTSGLVTWDEGGRAGRSERREKGEGGEGGGRSTMTIITLKPVVTVTFGLGTVPITNLRTLLAISKS
jgi:hypothetical protein